MKAFGSGVAGPDPSSSPQHQPVDDESHDGEGEPLQRIREVRALADRRKRHGIGGDVGGRSGQLEPHRQELRWIGLGQAFTDGGNIEAGHTIALPGVGGAEEAVLGLTEPHPTFEDDLVLGRSDCIFAAIRETTIHQHMVPAGGLEQPDDPIPANPVLAAVGHPHQFTVDVATLGTDREVVEIAERSELTEVETDQRLADLHRFKRRTIEHRLVQLAALIESGQLPKTGPDEDGDQRAGEHMGDDPFGAASEAPVQHDATVPGPQPARLAAVRFERGVPPARPIVTLCVAISIASMLSGWVGDLLLSQIVDRNPLLLIALNPRNRNLILATNELDALSYYLVGFFRLIASDPVNYLLGFWFGDRAIAWTERRSRTYGPLIRDGEHWFRRLSLPLIFAAPNNIICALAGATGVSLRMFAVLNVAGTVARLVAIRQLGATLESPISSVVDFIGQYRTPILIVSVIGVAWTVFGEFRGDNSELAALRKIEEEAEAAEAEATSRHEAD